ncbi:MAG: histidine phosphatase family protein [Gammaproteobacteria bacterium]|nr:histidine phosphatase family protein [Gammaproteobacteria bacterium]
MELHLIRHGETNWNKERRVQGQSESHLTDLGIQQAKELGQRIKHLAFDKIYCSSSLRTRQTAEYAFPESTTEISYLDELREIFLGPWEGHLYEDIAQREPDSHRHFWEQPHLFQVDGAESFFELQQRAIDAVTNIEATHRTSPASGRKVAIVSHGALIKSYLCHVEGRSMDQLWAPPRMHNCAHSIVAFSESDGSTNILQYADEPIFKE